MTLLPKDIKLPVLQRLTWTIEDVKKSLMTFYDDTYVVFALSLYNVKITRVEVVGTCIWYRPDGQSTFNCIDLEAVIKGLSRNYWFMGLVGDLSASELGYVFSGTGSCDIEKAMLEMKEKSIGITCAVFKKQKNAVVSHREK